MPKDRATFAERDATCQARAVPGWGGKRLRAHHQGKINKDILSRTGVSLCNIHRYTRRVLEHFEMVFEAAGDSAKARVFTELISLLNPARSLKTSSVPPSSDHATAMTALTQLCETTSSRARRLPRILPKTEEISAVPALTLLCETTSSDRGTRVRRILPKPEKAPECVWAASGPAVQDISLGTFADYAPPGNASWWTRIGQSGHTRSGEPSSRLPGGYDGTHPDPDYKSHILSLPMGLPTGPISISTNNDGFDSEPLRATTAPLTHAHAQFVADILSEKYLSRPTSPPAPTL